MKETKKWVLHRLSATILAHFFVNNEKINYVKVFGILTGFSGIVFLFSDNILNDLGFLQITG